MEYEYYISAMGSIKKKEIEDALKKLGLKNVVVEAQINNDSYIHSLSSEPKALSIEKWRNACESQKIWKENVATAVNEKIQGLTEISEKDLAQIICDCCNDLELSDRTQSIFLKAVFSN